MAFLALTLLMLTTNPPMIGATDATEMTPQTTHFTPSPESSNIRTQIPASVLTKATFSTSLSAAAFSEPVEEELIVPVTAQTVQSDLSSDETTPIPQSTAEDVEEVTNKTTASTVSTTMEVDLDESEPYFQRYCRTGNRIASGIGTTFLLTMILFAVTSKFRRFSPN